jgi:hypothetical protein
MCNGCWSTFKGVKCLGCDSDQHLHLEPRLRIRGTISVLRTCTSMVWTGINLEVVIIIVVVVVVVVVVHVP